MNRMKMFLCHIFLLFGHKENYLNGAFLACCNIPSDPPWKMLEVLWANKQMIRTLFWMKYM